MTMATMTATTATNGKFCYWKDVDNAKVIPDWSFEYTDVFGNLFGDNKVITPTNKVETVWLYN